MNVNLDRYLDPSDWMLVGYLVALALVYLFVDSGEPTEWDGQTYRLTERHLQRLENGKDVEIRRWHGGSVRLSGERTKLAEHVETVTVQNVEDVEDAEGE